MLDSEYEGKPRLYRRILQERIPCPNQKPQTRKTPVLSKQQSDKLPNFNKGQWMNDHPFAELSSWLAL